MSFETILVECSRQNSNNYKFDPTNSLNKENSRWTNNVNFKLKIGDQVSVENAIIHSIGNSEGSTIEINGEENENGFVDNQGGFEFLFYINNNGYNAVQLPYVGGYNARNKMELVELPFYNNSFVNSPFIGMTVNINTTTTDGVKIPDPDYNAPLRIGDGYNFSFQHKNFLWYEDSGENNNLQIAFEDNIFTLYKPIQNLDNPTGNFNYDCCKYILLSKSFKGYYRSSNDNLGNENGDFYDTNGDLLPYTQTVNFKVDKGFTTPATLCNEINEALHQTFENPDDEVQVKNADGEPIGDNVYQGKLFSIIEVNGSNTNDNSVNPCWGQLAVKDFKMCRGVYHMMRCSLAFDGRFRLDDQPTEYLINRPAIQIGGCVCRFKTADAGIIETSMYPYKRVPYTISGHYYQSEETFDPPSNGSFSNKNSLTLFSYLPEGWLITSNMKYTKENIERLRIYFEGTEKYEGDISDPDLMNTDVENWYCRLMLGSSLDGANTSNNRETSDNILSYQGKASEMRGLSSGSVQIDGFALTTLQGFDTGQIYSGGVPINPYSLNEHISGMKLGDDGTDYRFLTCPRSQTPRFGQKMYKDSGYITVGDTSLTHNFYDNKFGDCNLTVYSKFLDDFKDRIKQTNTSKQEADWEEGDGEIKHKVDVNRIDTSLENEYGIYGVPISKYNMEHEIYELCFDGNPLYLQAFADEYAVNNDGTVSRDGNFCQFYRFLTKIVPSTGGDQQQYGGYDLLNWNDDVSSYSFEKRDDIYIYTKKNTNFKPTHDVLSLTYRDGKKIDFDEYDNQVVFYKSSTFTWVGEIVDDPDHSPFTQIKIYPVDGMVFSKPENSRVKELYYQYYDIIDSKSTYTGTNLYVLPTINGTTSALALSPTLESKSSGTEVLNNNYPYLVTDNQETVCAFILKHSSYIENSDGGKTLNNCKHLLPVMYQSLYLCSPSFMDLPAIWTVNSISGGASSSYLSGGNAEKFMSVGASNPTFEFNNSLQKSTISDLHTSRILGITEMPFTDASQNELDTDTLGSVVSKYHGKKYPYYSIFDNISVTETTGSGGDKFFKVNYNENTQTLKNPQYATSGIMLYKIFGTKTDIDEDPVEIQTEEDFNNTLLFKLGFLRDDFFNKFGSQTALYDNSIVGKYDKANRYRNVNFLTTNPQIDISVEPFLSVYSGGLNAQFEGLPYYQLSYLPEKIPHTIDGSTSEQIIASNKPIKQNSAFYQIRSDLIATKYISNNEQVNTIGIGMKEYMANDFIYCNVADYGLTVLQEQNISNITTELRLANGTLAPTNQFNTVIYKIRRPIILEDIQTIVQNAQLEEKEYEKEIKQEFKN
jgi:hypothetical protein